MLALVAAITAFTRVFAPVSYVRADVADPGGGGTHLAAAMAPESVRARFSEIASCGSRAPGQVGLLRCADLIEKAYRDAGLELYEQDVEFAATSTDGGHGELTLDDASGTNTLPVWPLAPNYVQPVATPPAGVSGILFRVSDATLVDAPRYDDKIAVIDLASPVPNEFGVNPAQYAELGFQAIVYTHAAGKENISAADLRKMAFATLPANVVRVVADPGILSAIGCPATIKVRSRWINAQTRNLVGVLRSPGTKTKAAVVVPVYYDATSPIPDLAPGSHQALQTAIQLQLLDGMKRSRSPFKRDVIFVALTGGAAKQIGASRLVSTVGREGEAEAEGARIAADIAQNEKAVGWISEILARFDDPQFAETGTSATSASAIHTLSTDARKLFSAQFNYLMRRRVFAYAETLLQAEIAFKRNPDDLESAAYRTFRASKQHYDELNTLSALPFFRYLEKPQSSEGDFALNTDELAFDAGAGASLRRALSAHFHRLASHHDARASSLSRDAALQAMFARYSKLIVIAPDLNPSESVPDSETVGFSSGLSIAHAAAAQEFYRLLENSLHANDSRRALSVKPPARLESFSAELAGHAERLAATPWAALSHPAFSVISPMNAYVDVDDLPFGNPAVSTLASIASSMRLLGASVQACAAGRGEFQRLPLAQVYGYNGTVYVSGVGNSIVPNFPMAGALVTSPEKPSLITDPYGRFRAGFLIYPKSAWNLSSPLEAFSFDDDGLIRYVKDTGETAQRIYKSSQMLFDAPNNLILYRASPVALFDAVNPQSLKAFTGASFLARKGLLDFKSKSPYKDGFGMMDFIEPDQRFFVTLRAGSTENELVSVVRAFCLGTTLSNQPNFKPDPDSEIDGPGYLAQDTPVLRSVAREAAASMQALSSRRLALQTRFGMADEMTLSFHERAAASAADAREDGKPELERRRGFREALSYLILNHPVIHKSISDAIWGILWYMALLVPFMFFFEKLVFGFTDIRMQLLAEGAIFLVVFLLLRLLHPAFQIVRSSVMILLGFVIILIAGSATVLLSAKFQENIDALRRAQGAVKNAEGNKMGMMVTAFMLGLNNMHRRKVRTALTCASLVLMTFVMICFSSVQSNVVNRNRALGKAAYQGILVREPQFIPVTDSEIHALKARYGHRYDIVTRQTILGTYDPKEKKPTHASLAITGGAGAMATTRIAKAALLLDAKEPLAESIRLLTTNGWFTAAQQEQKTGMKPVILPDELAARLGIAPADVDAGDVKVSINGTPFLVHGIFASASFADARDVDGQNLLPFDIEALVSPRVQGVNVVLAESTDPRVSAEEVILVLNGHIEPANPRAIRTVSAVVGMTDADFPEARRDIDSHLEQTSRQTCYGLDGVAYIARRARVRSLGGLVDLIIPLIIAALTVLNTMKGSVYERRNEIFVYNAVGIAPRHIFFMFVAESLVYAVVGVVLGYVLAQGTGRLLMALDMTGGLNMNFTSLSTVYASLAIAAATILSTWFPARSAMEIAKPTEDAGWITPKSEGSELAFDLPFTFGHRDRIAVLGFFHAYFENLGEGSAGPFFAGKPRLGVADEPDVFAGDAYVPMIDVTVWCKPFDLGVSQRIEIKLAMDSRTHEYLSRMSMTRLTGTHDAWQRLNGPLVTRIREHFLHWRAASEEMKQEFYAKAKSLLEAGAEIGSEGKDHG